MEQSLSWEANSYSVNEEILHPYVTRRFIIVSTRDRHRSLSWSSWSQSTVSHQISLRSVLLSYSVRPGLASGMNWTKPKSKVVNNIQCRHKMSLVEISRVVWTLSLGVWRTSQTWRKKCTLEFLLLSFCSFFPNAPKNWYTHWRKWKGEEIVTCQEIPCPKFHYHVHKRSPMVPVLTTWIQSTP